jgi:sucrose-phosphate synthase
MRIVFLNPQGNFDRFDSHWTMHPDFGGQLVYVKEVAIAMAKMGHHVDIVTRLFDDIKFSEFVGELDYYNDATNVRIVRIPCGPKQFLNKEQLWEYLDEWTDNIIAHYKKEGIQIDFVTAHYGDGGLAAALLKKKVGIPYSFTGHSLGAQKFDKLNQDFTNLVDLEKKYRFSLRITAERAAMQNADVIFVSTSQERDVQYQHPLYKPVTQQISQSRFVIAPPGANTKIFQPFWEQEVDQLVKDKLQRHIQRDIDIARRDLPLIVLASRLDEKKNHVGLFEAYAGSDYLRKHANILVSLRGVENAFTSYANLKAHEQQIMDRIMQIIKTEKLDGMVTFVSLNSQKELANTYRFVAKKGGLFTLTALYEPFGLAPIEAMACGLPVAVTKYGGPSDVLKEGETLFGALLDVHDHHSIAEGLITVLKNHKHYSQMGYQRVMDRYTWNATAKKYLDAINAVFKQEQSKNEVFLPKWTLHTDQKPDFEFIKREYRVGLE